MPGLDLKARLVTEQERLPSVDATVVGVTSAGSGIGHSVIQSLERSDDPIVLVGFDSSLANASMTRLSARERIPLARDRDAYVRALLQHVGHYRIDVLIPCLDLELELIAGISATLAGLGCNTIVSDPLVTGLSDDKLALARFCQERDLDFVQTSSLAVGQHEADSLTYPRIVKPRMGSASEGVLLARSPEELRVLGPDDSLLVQEYLPPRELDGVEVPVTSARRIAQSHELSVQFALSPDGTILGQFASMNRLKDGIPVVVDPVTTAVDLSGARAIVQALAQIGARGPINLQGRIDSQGRPKYFEMNARFTGITHMRSLMGFHEVETAVRYFSPRPRAPSASRLHTQGHVLGFRPVADVVVPRERINSSPGSSSSLRGPRRLGNVVLTGAHGYLGSALRAALSECPDVDSITIITRSPRAKHEDNPLPEIAPVVSLSSFLDGDVLGVDTVFHLAALRPEPPQPLHELFESNVQLTMRIAQASEASGAGAFVLSSSQSVYGTSRPPPWDESLAPMPETAYAASKWSSEMVATTASRGHMMSTSARLGRLFGHSPTMRWTELPHQWARRAVAGEPLIINGDGQQRMDLVDVGDAAQGLIAIARSPRALQLPALNVGSGSPVSLVELARIVSAISRPLDGPMPIAIQHRELEGRAVSFGLAIDLIQKTTDWSPTTSLEDSMRRVVDAARGIQSEAHTVPPDGQH